MFVRVVGFLLETVFYLLMGAALLRAYMNWLRINMSAQPGTFVMALTSWLVKPLRQLLPQALVRSRLDWASLLAAGLLALLYALLAGLLFGWLGSRLKGVCPGGLGRNVKGQAPAGQHKGGDVDEVHASQLALSPPQRV